MTFDRETYIDDILTDDENYHDTQHIKRIIGI